MPAVALVTPTVVFRAWKQLDGPTLDRLHAKGFIDDPRSKAKSVHVTPEGVAEASPTGRVPALPFVVYNGEGLVGTSTLQGPGSTREGTKTAIPLGVKGPSADLAGASEGFGPGSCLDRYRHPK